MDTEGGAKYGDMGAGFLGGTGAGELPDPPAGAGMAGAAAGLCGTKEGSVFLTVGAEMVGAGAVLTTLTTTGEAPLKTSGISILSPVSETMNTFTGFNVAGDDGGAGVGGSKVGGEVVGGAAAAATVGPGAAAGAIIDVKERGKSSGDV